MENKEPIPMTCEYPLCSRTDGADYKRLEHEKILGWPAEPIYLCPDHGTCHQKIKTFNS
jgi:hypothetical protein